MNQAPGPISGNLPERSVLVIPVYNHGERIQAVVEKALTLGRPVVVVDDGSTDRTPWVLAGLPDIIFLRHEVNSGKGAALLTGFKAAAGMADWAVTLDADGQHDPGDAPGLFSVMKPGERAIVVGRREGMAREQAPWTSRFGRKFSNFWVRLAGGGPVSDSQSGFRLYPLPETLLLKAKARRFQFEIEILVLAAWSGLKVLEAPVGVEYASQGPRISHFRPGLDFWRNTRTFARLITGRILIPARWRARKLNRS